jgi:cardiolipin synthase
VDDDWATVGSSNIDPFSLLLAREANVVERDRAFTAELRGSLLHAMQDGGVELVAADWQHRSSLKRGLSWVAYGLVRLMIGLAGYAKQH